MFKRKNEEEEWQDDKNKECVFVCTKNILTEPKMNDNKKKTCLVGPRLFNTPNCEIQKKKFLKSLPKSHSIDKTKLKEKKKLHAKWRTCMSWAQLKTKFKNSVFYLLRLLLLFLIQSAFTHKTSSLSQSVKRSKHTVDVFFSRSFLK